MKFLEIFKTPFQDKTKLAFMIVAIFGFASFRILTNSSTSRSPRSSTRYSSQKQSSGGFFSFFNFFSKKKKSNSIKDFERNYSEIDEDEKYRMRQRLLDEIRGRHNNGSNNSSLAELERDIER